MRPIRNCRQVAISAGVGLFCGGTQRTVFEIMQSTSSSVLRRGDIVPSARKPDLEQRAVEQLAGIVAEEGPPGAVGAFQPGREPDDEEPRVVGAE